MPHCVYIIQSLQDGTYYKGHTTNYTSRLEYHNTGKSRYTSKKMPWKLVYLEELPDKTTALQKEKALKRANQQYLQWLMQQPANMIK